MLINFFTGRGNAVLWLILGAIAVVCIWRSIHRVQHVKRTSRMLDAQLRDIGELAVEEVRCTMVHCTKEPRRFFGMETPWTREQYIFTVDVIIKIGFDVDDIDVRVSNLRKKITMNLPAMRVLSSAVDYESATMLDEKTGVFAGKKLMRQFEAVHDLVREAEARVRGYGAFERAEASAKTRLEAFVAKLYDLTEYDLRIIPAGGVQEDAAEKKTSACA